MADVYQSKLQAQIQKCDERLRQIRNELAELVVRQKVLAEALELYVENKPRRAVKRSPKSRSVSKFGFIMNVIAESGQRGLMPAEMYARAEAAGVKVKRNTVRSQLWQRKDAGVLEQTPEGRYRMASAGKNNEAGDDHSVSDDETPDDSAPPGVSNGSGDVPLYQ